MRATVVSGALLLGAMTWGKNAGIGQRGMALLVWPSPAGGRCSFGSGSVAQRHQHGQGGALRRFKAPDLVHFPKSRR